MTFVFACSPCGHADQAFSPGWGCLGGECVVDGYRRMCRLWDALKRSYLVDQTKPNSLDLSSEDGAGGSQTPSSGFTLDTRVEDEGNNFSVGQVRYGTVHLTVSCSNTLFSALWYHWLGLW